MFIIFKPYIYFFIFLFFPFNSLAATNTNLWAEGFCSDTISQGANREYYNRGASFAWENTLGDWRDKKNISQGDEPYAKLSIPDLDQQQSFDINLTEMVANWTSLKIPNQGILIKSRTSGKTQLISKENIDKNLIPKLTIQSDQGTFVIPATADTSLRAYTYICSGNTELLTTTGNILIYFDLSNIQPHSYITDAYISLSTSENQYGVSELDFYRVAIPSKAYGGRSLARQYPNDYRMLDNPNTVFTESFEDEDWASSWTYNHSQQNHSLVTENENEQFSPLMGKALQVRLLEGNLSGMNVGYVFADKLGEDKNEIYFRYYLRLGSNWQTLENGKLPGIAGTYVNSDSAGGWGGRTSNGKNGWSARGLFKTVLKDNNTFSGQVPLGNYLYHADQIGAYGDMTVYDGVQPGMLKRGQWYSIEQYVKMNTPGLNDGILRAWIDGEVAYERTNIKFRNEGYDHIKIDKVWMDIYHGGVLPNNQDLYAFIDNVVIASEYIGPINFNKSVPIAGTEPNGAPIIDDIKPSDKNIEIAPFETLKFTATVTDPENDAITSEWFLNGELITTEQLSYEFTSSYSRLGDHLVELKVRDKLDNLATESWIVSVTDEKWLSLPVIEDTLVANYTFEAQGYKPNFSVGIIGNQTAYLRFGNLDGDELDNIKSIFLVLFDKNQYGPLVLSVFAGNEKWFEGSNKSEGATRYYSDWTNHVPWDNYMGDWIDSAGTKNGLQAFTTAVIDDIDKPRLIYIDVKSLVLKQENKQTINIVLKANSGKHGFYSRESTVEGTQPMLLIETY